MGGRLNLGEAVGGIEAFREGESSAERRKKAAERVGDSLLALAEDKESSLAAGIRPSPEVVTAHSSCNYLAVGT